MNIITARDINVPIVSTIVLANTISQRTCQLMSVWPTKTFVSRLLERLLIKWDEKIHGIFVFKYFFFFRCFVSCDNIVSWLSILTICFFLLQTRKMTQPKIQWLKMNHTSVLNASNHTIIDEIYSVIWSTNAVSKRKSHVNSVHT